MKLEVRNLTCGYHGNPILQNLSFSLDSGEILCILGPNGVGKTTLFKTMLGLLPAISGEVLVDQTPYLSRSAKMRAQLLGYVPQAHTPPFPYTVRQVVVMGRTAHLGLTSAPGARDYAIADQVLARLQLSHLAEQDYTKISGGERQMVLIARALTQSPEILFMDEPTANLDFGNQAQVLSTIRQLAKTGMSVIMTTHAPDHALLLDANTMLLSRQGIRIGSAKEIITAPAMEQTYRVPIVMTHGSRDQQVVTGCMPLIGRASLPNTERKEHEL